MEIKIEHKNLGTINKNAVRIGRLTFYFSYDTLVGFGDGFKGYISKNIWSNTTGKFISELEPRISNRLEYDDFQAKLKEVLIEHGLYNNLFMENL